MSPVNFHCTNFTGNETLVEPVDLETGGSSQEMFSNTSRKWYTHTIMAIFSIYICCTSYQQAEYLSRCTSLDWESYLAKLSLKVEIQ